MTFQTSIVYMSENNNVNNRTYYKTDLFWVFFTKVQKSRYLSFKKSKKTQQNCILWKSKFSVGKPTVFIVIHIFWIFNSQQ